MLYSPNFQQLRQFRLLSGLSDAELKQLSQALDPCDFLPEGIILSRKDPVDALYFILEGVVRVELCIDHGEVYNLLELGAGEIFGERALLTDEPRTADVRAVTAVTAARLKRSDFEMFLPLMPGLYANLCRDLARQLGSWAQRHQREEQERRDLLSHIVGWQLLPEFNSFPGSSLWIKNLNRRLQGLSASRSHVLIVGEAGTWKDLAARLIHYYGTRTRPVLFLDCATPPPRQGQEGRDKLFLLHQAQEAALFGLPREGFDYVSKGMIELAHGGEMIVRNIDCLCLEVQRKLREFLQSGRFRVQGQDNWHYADVRIISTSSEPLDVKVSEGALDAALYEIIRTERIVMLPLRERKKDIPVIARQLLKTLNAKHHKKVRRISHEAMNHLLDHDWPLNGTELYQVLSRAILLCDGDKILIEHISLQGHPFGNGRFNLLSLPAVDRWARRPDFPRRLRWMTVPLFIVMTIYLFMGPDVHNLANLAVWTLWWPALLLSSIFFARAWCSYCPLEAIGELAGAKTKVIREPQDWLRRWGGSTSLFALIIILLTEKVTGMFVRPFATGVLLAGLLAATVNSDLILGRRGWCKYLCPLGRVVSLFSRISILEMRSNHNVCNSRCQIDDCIKEKGCPMGLHPSGINNSDHCVLCFNCARQCPHHSMQLDLRNPAWGLFNRARRGFSEALFSVALTGVILVTKGLPLLFDDLQNRSLSESWTPQETALAIFLIALYCGLAMVSSIGRRRSRWRATFTIYGMAYLPLAFTALFLLYFREMIAQGDKLLPLTLVALGLGGWVDLALFSPELGTLRLMIPPLLIAGTFFAWKILGHLQQQYLLNRYGVIAHRTLVLCTATGFLWML